MRRIGSIMAMLAMMVLLVAGVTGCNTMSQSDFNMAAESAGALAVGAYNIESNKFTPLQKEAAAKAIEVLTEIGTITTDGNIGDVKALANAALAKQIKDPAQLALAQQSMATFFAVVQPYIDKAMSKYGTTGAAQVFLSFCKGVAAVPITGIKERHLYTLYMFKT